VDVSKNAHLRPCSPGLTLSCLHCHRVVTEGGQYREALCEVALAVQSIVGARDERTLGVTCRVGKQEYEEVLVASKTRDKRGPALLVGLPVH